MRRLLILGKKQLTLVWLKIALHLSVDLMRRLRTPGGIAGLRGAPARMGQRGVAEWVHQAGAERPLVRKFGWTYTGIR